jgi:hypothetical protein
VRRSCLSSHDLCTCTCRTLLSFTAGGLLSRKGRGQASRKMDQTFRHIHLPRLQAKRTQKSPKGVCCPPPLTGEVTCPTYRALNNIPWLSRHLDTGANNLRILYIATIRCVHLCSITCMQQEHTLEESSCYPTTAQNATRTKAGRAAVFRRSTKTDRRDTRSNLAPQHQGRLAAEACVCTKRSTCAPAAWGGAAAQGASNWNSSCHSR